MNSGRILGVSLLILLLAGIGNAQAPSAKPAEFPIPAHILPLSKAVTPQQYAQAILAIRAELANREMKKSEDEGLDLGPLEWMIAAKVPLGSLGNGLMVWFLHSRACGTGGCPMWLLAPDQSGYRVVLAGGGGLFRLANSGTSVPDIIFYWHMSAVETNASRFHYAGDKFTTTARNQTVCVGNSEKGDCAGREDAPHWPVWTIAPAQYSELARYLNSGPVRTAPQSSQAFTDHAHSLDFNLFSYNAVARVVGIGDCTPQSNCTISIYACSQTYPDAHSGDLVKENLPACQLWPMLTDISGWGVAYIADRSKFLPTFSFIVARHLSSSETEYVRYTATRNLILSHRTTGPLVLQPGTKFVADSCEIAIADRINPPDRQNQQLSVTRPEPCPMDTR